MHPSPSPDRLLAFSRRLLLPLFGAVALAAVGCNSQSTTPGPGPSDPTFVSVPQDGTDTPLAASAAPRAPLSVTRRISALTGGTIVCGRHTLTLLPGSLLTDTDITVVDMSPSLGVVEAQLYPEGLHFVAPVTLSMRIGDAVGSANGYHIYWRDPLLGLLPWIDVGGVLSPDGKSVSTVLLHFSRYRAGKAGW